MKYDFVSIGGPQENKRNEFIAELMSMITLDKDKTLSNSFYDFNFTVIGNGLIVEIKNKSGNVLCFYKWRTEPYKAKFSDEEIQSIKSRLAKANPPIPPDGDPGWLIDTMKAVELFVDRRCTEAEENEILFNLKMYVF